MTTILVLAILIGAVQLLVSFKWSCSKCGTSHEGRLHSLLFHNCDCQKSAKEGGKL